MINQDNIDLNLILSFTNHYESLYEDGKITEEQLNQILSLLDNFDDYSPEEFKEKMINIFNKEEYE